MHQARMSRARLSRAGSPAPGNRQKRHQRCAVRVTYSRNVVKGQWRAHGRYAARDTATSQEEGKESGFDSVRENCDIASALDNWQKSGDERIWKLIISPEFGERIDLRKLTRELLTQMGRDTGSELEWVAAAHYNTEHPHVHVALRGAVANGMALRLERDYVQHGIRAISEDLCTRQIGYRTERDAQESTAREVRGQRFTSIDRDISRNRTEGSEHGMFEIALPSDSPLRPNPRQQSQAARLLVLGNMGLAQKTGSHSWQVRQDFEAVLRAMQRVNDHQRTIAASGVFLSDARLPFVRLDLRTMKSVEGRVLVHGEEESGPNIGGNYLLLEGTDARVHYVSYTPEIEDARGRGELPANSFVRLRRLFIEGKPLMEVEDLGSADEVLNNKRHLREGARYFHARGVRPIEEGWGGWLGRYQAALAAAFGDIENQMRPKEPRRGNGKFGR